MPAIVGQVLADTSNSVTPSRTSRVNHIQRRIYRLPQVMAATGFGRAWIYTLMGRGEFPKAVKIGQRSVGWDADLVDKWVATRLDGVA